MLNTTNRIRILLWLLISILPISSLAAALLETTQPIKFESTPKLFKVGSLTQISAKSVDYSDKLPIDGVAIRLQSESKPEVYFRFLDPSGTWSDWKTAHLFEEPFSNRWIATYNDEIADNSHSFEVKIEVTDNGIVEILEQGIFPVDTEIYPDGVAQPLEYQTDVPKPIIISRQEWGARLPNGSYSNMPYYDKLTIHHAAGWGARNLQEGILAVQSIQDFHIDGRGWTDIAYHFLIDKAGNIFQGRPETVIGAHVMNHNTGNLGVCILGCYHPEETAYFCNDHLTQESRDAAVHLFAWLADKFNYKDRVLLGHRDYYDYPHTSCPGNNIHKLLPEIREEIYTFRQLGGKPFEYSASNNYPNPFYIATNIVYDIPVESDVSITIYNVKGESVIDLVNEKQPKGSYSINWNGQDSQNNLSPTGVYFYQIQTHQNVTSQLDENFSKTGKMLFLK